MQNAVIVVGASMVLAIAGLFLVRRIADPLALKENNEVAGFIYAVIGVVYAVILAFMVVAVWEHYSEAERNVEIEAAYLSELLYQSKYYPDPARNNLREGILVYVQAVVDDEWISMAQSRESQRAWTAVQVLIDRYNEFRPQTPYEIAIYNESLVKLREIGKYRNLRLYSSHGGLPAVMWLLLIAGGAIIVGVCYIFGMKNAWAHFLIVSSLAGLIAFCLFLIVSMDRPFKGAMRVEPTAFKELRVQ
jgi:hypothetical protein